MDDKTLLGSGLAGFSFTAVCCFTPALVFLLGAAGLSAWLAWVDFILLPGMVFFLGLTGYALMRRYRKPSAPCNGAEDENMGLNEYGKGDRK